MQQIVSQAAKADEQKGGFLGFKADWLLKDSLDLGAGYETDLKDTPFFDPKIENAKIPDGTKKGKVRSQLAWLDPHSNPALLTRIRIKTKIAIRL